MSEDYRQKCREINKGRIVSEETKRKMSEAHKGNHYSLGRKLSEEHKRKIGEFFKGNKYNLGRILSLEHRRKIGEGNKGKIISEEQRKKMSDTHKRNGYGTGRIRSLEARKKTSASLMGHITTEETKKKIGDANRGSKGIHFSEERRRKMSEFQKAKVLKGEHNLWKGGIYPANKKIRKSFEYKNWRQSVFLRDDFTCQECHTKGGYLEAHHKKSFSILVQEAKDYMPLFDIITSCKLYTPMWDLDNGITLCVSCHNKTKGKRGNHGR